MVPGEGPQPARGMVVGEAPGRKEVELGRPFVGSAGRLLDGVLRSLGVARDGLYITNVVKDLPLDAEGNIRRPTQSEISEWAPWLASEIQYTAPVAILALGRTAADALAPPGTPFGSFIAPNVYVALHPAYFLHPRKLADYSQAEWLEQVRPWAEAIA